MYGKRLARHDEKFFHDPPTVVLLDSVHSRRKVATRREKVRAGLAYGDGSGRLRGGADEDSRLWQAQTVRSAQAGAARITTVAGGRRPMSCGCEDSCSSTVCATRPRRPRRRSTLS